MSQSNSALDEDLLEGSIALIGCGKAKRDVTDDDDLEEAVVAPGVEDRFTGLEGPLWEAQDLYTSTYFTLKNNLAELVGQWFGGPTSHGYAILSAEHDIVEPNELLAPYDTTVDDLGDDPDNPQHQASAPHLRPDGEYVVTEMDLWASEVAIRLTRWVSRFSTNGDGIGDDAETLLVFTGSSYLEPLRERGVFEYGTSRMSDHDGMGSELDLDVRFVFDEIDASGIGKQMGWLSDQIDRLEPIVAEREKDVRIPTPGETL